MVSFLRRSLSTQRHISLVASSSLSLAFMIMWHSPTTLRSKSSLLAVLRLCIASLMNLMLAFGHALICFIDAFLPLLSLFYRSCFLKRSPNTLAVITARHGLPTGRAINADGVLDCAT